MIRINEQAVHLCASGQSSLGWRDVEAEPAIAEAVPAARFRLTVSRIIHL